MITEQYSRIPVYEQTIDQIIGFVHVRDMFELEEEEREHRTVRELVRTIRFVPETKPVNDLMRQMQQENTHMVIVVDEYGNTAGLATMEDLLEVIIGEIRDEHEPDSDVTEDGHGGFIVSGNLRPGPHRRPADSFHREEDIESTTVGGLVSEWLGRVPKAGESVERDGMRIEVLACDELRVEQVRHQQIPNGGSMTRESETELKTEYKSGFVSLIGRPNAGKSTLLNALVGQKVAIVADKPQTTRTSIQGVVTLPEAQIVFIDTPGIHKADSQLNKRLMDTVRASLEERDLLLFVADAARTFGEEDRHAIDLARRTARPWCWC